MRYIWQVICVALIMSLSVDALPVKMNRNADRNDDSDESLTKSVQNAMPMIARQSATTTSDETWDEGPDILDNDDDQEKPAYYPVSSGGIPNENHNGVKTTLNETGHTTATNILNVPHDKIQYVGLTNADENVDKADVSNVADRTNFISKEQLWVHKKDDAAESEDKGDESSDDDYGQFGFVFALYCFVVILLIFGAPCEISVALWFYGDASLNAESIQDTLRALIGAGNVHQGEISKEECNANDERVDAKKTSKKPPLKRNTKNPSKPSKILVKKTTKGKTSILEEEK